MLVVASKNRAHKKYGSAAGEHIRRAQCKGAAPTCPPTLKAKAEASEAEGRANQMKFDIFRKPPPIITIILFFKFITLTKLIIYNTI